jgi:hypothetical protein
MQELRMKILGDIGKNREKLGDHMCCIAKPNLARTHQNLFKAIRANTHWIISEENLEIVTWEGVLQYNDGDIFWRYGTKLKTRDTFNMYMEKSDEWKDLEQAASYKQTIDDTKWSTLALKKMAYN